MICAVCLRLGRPLITDDERPELHAAGGAITIANGHALCREHYERFSDVQNEVHGTPSLLALIARMHAPYLPPEQPWLPRHDDPQ